MGGVVPDRRIIFSKRKKTLPAIRASFKDSGHFHRWKFIEIIFSNIGNWFSSLFPPWKLIQIGIPRIGN